MSGSSLASPACPRCGAALAPPPPDRPGSWVCAGCAGLWLERAAFVHLCAGLKAGAVVRPGARVAASAPAGCPACGATMSRIVVGEPGVTVDACRHGVWLDAGELDHVKGAGGTDAPLRREVEQRLAPLVGRGRAPLFADLSVDRPSDPRLERLVEDSLAQVLGELKGGS